MPKLELEEVGSFNTESLRKRKDGGDSGVDLSTFNAPQLPVLNTRIKGKRFHSKPLFQAELPEVLAKGYKESFVADVHGAKLTEKPNPKQDIYDLSHTNIIFTIKP